VPPRAKNWSAAVALWVRGAVQQLAGGGANSLAFGSAPHDLVMSWNGAGDTDPARTTGAAAAGHD
jgi:hypothetical protein